MLKVRGLAAGYGRGTVLSDTDLTVGKGELVALIGANGAGKSTLMKSIAGLLPVYRGEILLDGERIEALNPAARVLRGLCLVPEGRQIFGGHSVEENLRLGAYARSDEEPASLQRMIEELCQLFPMLLPRLKDVAANLSGGQQQILAIARGLMSRPQLLLLDEPSLGLAPALVTETFSMIARVRERGISILLSEQNARQSLAIADRAYVLENGRIAIAGRSSDILASAEVAKKYLGVGYSIADAAGMRKSALGKRLLEILSI
jgi:branched-chain amino acid transport system ATP-binding protein